MTKEVVGTPPKFYNDPVVFRITITNDGETTIVVLPLIDTYPVTYLQYENAEPASDDNLDDGEIIWSDLTEQLGDLEPGESISVLVNFRLKSFPPDGEQIENIALVEFGIDELGRVVTADARVFVLTDPQCTELYVNNTEILVTPDPNAPPGRNILIISATVRNKGPFGVTQARVDFFYEKTPSLPEDDPNPAVIGTAETGAILVGSGVMVSIPWDVTEFEQGNRPVYVFPSTVEYPECLLDYTQTDITVPVKLSAFETLPGDTQVELVWTTETEVNNLGFRIYRSQTYSGNYAQIGPNLIPGAGTSFTRKTYRFTDLRLTNGQPYFYKLATVDGAGHEELSPIAIAVPAERPVAMTLHTRADDWIYAVGDRWQQLVKAENSGTAVTGRFWLLLAAEGAAPVALFADVPVTIPAGFTAEGAVFDHRWTGNEQPGRYIVYAALMSESGSLLLLDAADFSYRQ